MTTYTALRYQDNLYLVREPVLERPEWKGKTYMGLPYVEHETIYECYKENTEAYTNWLTKKEGWILVPRQHEHLFEGRTGMVEGKDFEHVWNCNKANSGCCGYDEEKDTCECMVAIPKEPGAGEEDYFMKIIKILERHSAGEYPYYGVSDSKFVTVAGEILKTITRKKQ